MRQRPVRRGAHRRRRDGGDLSDAAGVIRPAVEAALNFARRRAAATPPEPPPRGLVRILGFAKMTPAALRTVAKVVEEDDEFRARVAADVDEEQVGRAGWLWLARPEGWEEELAAIEADEQARRQAERAARDERAALRRLAVVEQAVARAEAEAAQQREELARVFGALEAERSQRLAAEAEVAALRSRIDQTVEERHDAVRALKRIEGELVERSTEVNALRAQVRELEASAGLGEAATGRTGGESTPTVVSPAPGTLAGLPDGAELAARLADAAGGAAALAETLAEIASQLTSALAAAPPVPVTGGEPSARRGTVPADVDVAGPGGPGGAGGAPITVRREPVRLPGGVFDDSPEAAEHLLRVAGIRLLVDGYNVSMQGWPDLPVSEQRRRLVAVLDELAARTATHVVVVFDGADVDGSAVRTSAPYGVQVKFSPAGVEADDVLIDLVARLPRTQPVVVASSDQRVREGARRHGANLLYADQLLAAAGRAAG